MEKQFVKIVKSPQERCYFFAGFFFLGPAALCMGPHEQFALALAWIPWVHRGGGAR